MDSKKELIASWRAIVLQLHTLGYDILLQDEINVVATQLRKDIGVDQEGKDEKSSR